MYGAVSGGILGSGASSRVAGKYSLKVLPLLPAVQKFSQAAASWTSDNK